MATYSNVIDNFCTSRNPVWLEKLTYNTKQFFLIMSKLVIEKQRGNQDIAQIVVENLTIHGDVTIARLGGRGKTWPQAPDDYIKYKRNKRFYEQGEYSLYETYISNVFRSRYERYMAVNWSDGSPDI